MEDRDIKELLTKNLAISAEILEISRKTRRYILFGQVMGVLKILIIAIPVILGILYLPPFIEGLLASYQDLLKGGGAGNLLP